MLKLDEILKDTVWVVKMQGWRRTGTYDELKHLAESEDCRDFDICAKQPTEELQKFWDALYEYEKEHGDFVTAQDFYPIYAKLYAKPKKVWTEDEIKELVQTNDTVLYRALKKLYACQTVDEKAGRHTNEQNGKGFNKFDAEFLSSVSEFLIKTGFLTDKQKVVVRKKLVKYNKQLTALANA